MQVHNIQSNNYNLQNSPNFGELKISESGMKFLKSNIKNPEKFTYIETLKQKLANTKYFDLVIDKYGNDLYAHINSKNSIIKYGCEHGLHAHKILEDNALHVYGTDQLDVGDWVSYKLNFNSNHDAITAYNKLNEYSSGCNYEEWDEAEIINELDWAVYSTELLENEAKNRDNQSTHFAAVSKSETETKEPFLQRLKKAWQALKG